MSWRIPGEISLELDGIFGRYGARKFDRSPWSAEKTHLTYGQVVLKYTPVLFSEHQHVRSRPPNALQPRARRLRSRALRARRHPPDLAGEFEVGPSPIDQWIARHCQFAETVQQGRDVADATAVESLFTRIIGDNHQAKKVFRYRGEPKTAACAKMSGGNAGNAGNLQSLGNSGLFGPAAKRRKLAEIGGNPLQILWSGIRPPFCCLTQGCSPNSQCRHRLRKLRKLLVPAGNDTAPARLL